MLVVDDIYQFETLSLPSRAQEMFVPLAEPLRHAQRENWTTV